MTTVMSDLEQIPGLVRCETVSRGEGFAIAAELTHAVYPHDQIYGRFCTVQEYIDCPIDIVYDYLADVAMLDEWTYSTRHFVPTGTPGLYLGSDEVADDTKIYLEVHADPAARTVDYHCAWDQGKELWMIYLIRLVDAELVLNRPGTVVLWTNCRHPYYDRNPYPETVPDPNRVWVGDMWGLFYAGHAIEMANLKAILEYRHGTAGGR
jgi:hypothetical protein